MDRLVGVFIVFLLVLVVLVCCCSSVFVYLFFNGRYVMLGVGKIFVVNFVVGVFVLYFILLYGDDFVIVGF